jgi:hypothetical protein
MAPNITVYPSYNHESQVVSAKERAAAFGLPELQEQVNYGRSYPVYLTPKRTETVVQAVCKALLRVFQ